MARVAAHAFVSPSHSQILPLVVVEQGPGMICRTVRCSAGWDTTGIKRMGQGAQQAYIHSIASHRIGLLPPTVS